MLFAHDTVESLVIAIALVNTGHEGTIIDLHAMLDAHGWTGRRDGTESELVAVRELAPQIRTIWASASLDDDGHTLVEHLNTMLATYRPTPWLTRHAEQPAWHIHVSNPDDPLHRRLGADLAMALTDVVRSGEMGRLKICASEDCDDILFDFSKNRSRRFCDTGNCGNREHVAAYRARKSKG